MPRESNSLAGVDKPYESFKSTLVDYTESMNEKQITKLTFEQSRSILMHACQNGDLRTVRKLAQVRTNGLDLVNFCAKSSFDSKGNLPIHIAANAGHADIAELLIRKMNADVDAVNECGETALHLACN